MHKLHRLLASLGILIVASGLLAGCGGGHEDGVKTDAGNPTPGESSMPSGGTGEESRAPRRIVFVSVLPQKGVVERIGGNRVTVYSMVEQGSDPHSFSASAKQMVMLGKADAYFTIGMPLEKQYLPKIQETRPGLQVTSMLDGIDQLPMAAHHHPKDEEAHDADEGHDHDADETHDGEEGHDHQAEAPHENGHDGHNHGAHDPEEHVHVGELDPHVWLSPALLKVLAWNIAKALTEADPAGADYYEANVDAFEADLDALDIRLKEKLDPHRGKAFYVFHPAFGYFAEAYHLQQHAVESNGQSLTPKQLLQLATVMKAEAAKVIFAQPQFDAKGAKVLGQQIGATVESIDPLEEDVIANLEKIANTIEAALR